MSSRIRWGILVVSLFSFSYAGIIRGTDTVLYNHNIQFSPHSITSNPKNWMPAGFVYSCATSTPQMDLFVAEELLGTCIYICHGLAVGSPRPFYLSKTAFDSAYFSVTIPNLNDTTRFTRCDTVRNDPHVRDTVHCYFPHVGNSLLAPSAPSINPGYFAIIQNSANQYIVARFDTIMAIDVVCEPICADHPYLKGYKIRWYLQTNGTFDFRGFAGIAEKDPVRSVTQKKTGNSAEYFSVSGRRFASESPSPLKVVIERDAKGRIHKQITVKK
jgi:hypothetical protein